MRGTERERIFDRLREHPSSQSTADEGSRETEVHDLHAPVGVTLELEVSCCLAADVQRPDANIRRRGISAECFDAQLQTTPPVPALTDARVEGAVFLGRERTAQRKSLVGVRYARGSEGGTIAHLQIGPNDLDVNAGHEGRYSLREAGRVPAS